MLLQLVRGIDARVPAMRADGPVSLSDRAAHVAQLERAAGGDWLIVPYTYDVAGVLAGDVPYRHGIKSWKITALEERQRDEGGDGLAMGLRRAESRGRSWNADLRGHTYRMRGRLTCNPLGDWTADEVVGAILASNQLPLNPVYERQHLQFNLERLRDGTWMPNQTADAHGYRAWLQYHYPEHLVDYDRAVIVLKGGR